MPQQHSKQGRKATGAGAERKPRKKQGRAEEALTVAAATNLRHYESLGLLSAIWYHVPNGGSRNIAQGAMRKRMGVRRGTPDLVFHWRDGSGFIELKSESGSLEPEQKTFRDLATSLGCKWALCRSVRQVEEHLTEWGVLHA